MQTKMVCGNKQVHMKITSTVKQMRKKVWLRNSLGSRGKRSTNDRQRERRSGWISRFWDCVEITETE